MSDGRSSPSSSFPGSNDDRDAALALGAVGADARARLARRAHASRRDRRRRPPGRLLVRRLPALRGDRDASRRSWTPSREFAAAGGPVLGICNGFQILCEARLLPGVLRPNRQLEFVCRDVALRVESADSAFTARCAVGQELVIPVKHGRAPGTRDEGTFVAARGARPDRPSLRRGRERRARQRRGRRRTRPATCSG